MDFQKAGESSRIITYTWASSGHVDKLLLANNMNVLDYLHMTVIAVAFNTIRISIGQSRFLIA